MKTLNEWGVAIALLLATSTTVMTTDHATLTAASGRGAALPHKATTSQLPPTADVLRGPYEWSGNEGTGNKGSGEAYAIADVLRGPYEESTETVATADVATADVLREGYEEVGPHAPNVIASSGQQ